MSGIATATAAMAAACRATHAQILETRKTVPGLRVLDKWAVLIGGGRNHRMGLYDMIMIKDNHIAAAGGLRAAVKRAREYVRHAGRRIEIEVETRTLEVWAAPFFRCSVVRFWDSRPGKSVRLVQEVREALACLDDDEDDGGGSLVTRVMLDNMVTPDTACEGSPSSGMRLCRTLMKILCITSSLQPRRPCSHYTFSTWPAHVGSKPSKDCALHHAVAYGDSPLYMTCPSFPTARPTAEYSRAQLL
jgi:hypothetical protein